MELIRKLLALFIGLVFLISCNSCDPLCLDGGDETTIQIEVPFEVSPQNEIYSIGDTITLSLFMDEYYSLSTDESLPIKENLIENYFFTFFDSTGYKYPPDMTPSIDSFNFILDSSSRKFYSSVGTSEILFRGDFDRENERIRYNAKFITKSSGFYILAIGWDPSLIDGNLTDLTDDCGKEYYTLKSIINGGKKDFRNTHLVEDDSTLLRNTLDSLYSGLSVDSILNLPYLYYFYVEE